MKGKLPYKECPIHRIRVWAGGKCTICSFPNKSLGDYNEQIIQ